ncbi:hypothetical protein Q3G72_019558 [Acer saccharum]|nr:hypothetical protein Q3G72_008884 [Acer saccharum]KAK1577175.1 hypothetical protein Q3G72_019558 [Acer saccharum]
MDLQEGTGGLRVLGNLRRNPIQAIRSINESMKPYYRNIIGPVNRIGRQFMSWASVFPSIWCLIKILIDPFYRYTSRINYDKKCVAVDDNSSQLVLGFISTVMYFVASGGCIPRIRR